MNNITIPTFNYDSAESNANKDTTLSLSTLDITGSYSNTDNSEKLYSYKMRLLDSGNVLEESDILYSSQYINANQFAYTFKTELKQDENYIFELEYSTNNKYNGKVKIPFQVIYAAGTAIDALLRSAETGAKSLTYAEEEDCHHIEEKNKKVLHIKEDKEDTEDCSKIGETVSNEEDSERTITEEESLTEHKNEDSDDEVIDINKI